MHTISLFLNHCSLLRHVDTIKELTDILVLDGSRLLNLRARKRYLGNINTRDFDLIFHISSSDVLHTLKELDTADLLLAQEVANFDNLLAIDLCVGHVDGKVGIAEAHLVLVALGHTSDHVLNVRADGADAGQGLVGEGKEKREARW